MTMLDEIREKAEKSLADYLDRRYGANKKERAMAKFMIHVRSRIMVFHLLHGRLPTDDEIRAELFNDPCSEHPTAPEDRPTAAKDTE